jgi:hypothetical protein
VGEKEAKRTEKRKRKGKGKAVSNFELTLITFWKCKRHNED